MSSITDTIVCLFYHSDSFTFCPSFYRHRQLLRIFLAKQSLSIFKVLHLKQLIIFAKLLNICHTSQDLFWRHENFSTSLLTFLFLTVLNQISSHQSHNVAIIIDNPSYCILYMSMPLLVDISCQSRTYHFIIVALIDKG